MALKITKEDFVDAVNSIAAGLEKRHNFNKAMENFTSTYYVTTIGDEWLTTLEKLLSSAVGDSYIEGIGTTLEWFLYENAEKVIYIDEVSPINNQPTRIAIDVSTPEKLYDYFEKYGELS